MKKFILKMRLIRKYNHLRDEWVIYWCCGDWLFINEYTAMLGHEVRMYRVDFTRVSPRPLRLRLRFLLKKLFL